MKKHLYPYIALAIGLILSLIVMQGSVVDAQGITRIPLLTLLIISEFGFFATAIGVYIGVRHLMAIGINWPYLILVVFNGLFALRFLLMGLALWPSE